MKLLPSVYSCIAKRNKPLDVKQALSKPVGVNLFSFKDRNSQIPNKYAANVNKF